MHAVVSPIESYFLVPPAWRQQYYIYVLYRHVQAKALLFLSPYFWQVRKIENLTKLFSCQLFKLNKKGVQNFKSCPASSMAETSSMQGATRTTFACPRFPTHHLTQSIRALFHNHSFGCRHRKDKLPREVSWTSYWYRSRESLPLCTRWRNSSFILPAWGSLHHEKRTLLLMQGPPSAWLFMLGAIQRFRGSCHHRHWWSPSRTSSIGIFRR